jgi:hypothetical protein
MNEYQIGRDLQDLRSRIDRLEAGVHGNHEMDDRYGLGHASATTLMGAVSGKPIAWEQPKSYPLPAFVTGFLNVEPALLQTLADVQTWTCVPEPLVFTVTWDAGGVDEFYRLANQRFSIIRFRNPDTGATTAKYSYSAQKIASGRGRTAGPQPNSMGIHLRDGAGGSLFHWAHNYWVGCRDNHVVVFEKDFPAGLYDIVRGATWEHVGVRINRC